MKAVLSELHTQHGLSASTESFVLTGGSAGGMATLLNADYVRSLVQDIAPAAKYVAVPDSGYFMDGKLHSLPGLSGSLKIFKDAAAQSCQEPCAPGRRRTSVGAPPAPRHTRALTTVGLQATLIRGSGAAKPSRSKLKRCTSGARARLTTHARRRRGGGARGAATLGSTRRRTSRRRRSSSRARSTSGKVFGTASSTTHETRLRSSTRPGSARRHPSSSSTQPWPATTCVRAALVGLDCCHVRL